MKSRLQTVRSSDGTTIAYEQSGTGPALVLIHGSISDRSYWTPVVPVLAEHFNVVTVDRRGRGTPGTLRLALERESEDIAAVVAAISEPVHLVGHSDGGLCARCGAGPRRSPAPRVAPTARHRRPGRSPGWRPVTGRPARTS